MQVQKRDTLCIASRHPHKAWLSASRCLAPSHLTVLSGSTCCSPVLKSRSRPEVYASSAGTPFAQQRAFTNLTFWLQVEAGLDALKGALASGFDQYGKMRWAFQNLALTTCHDVLLSKVAEAAEERQLRT